MPFIDGDFEERSGIRGYLGLERRYLNWGTPLALGEIATGGHALVAQESLFQRSAGAGAVVLGLAFMDLMAVIKAGRSTLDSE